MCFGNALQPIGQSGRIGRRELKDESRLAQRSKGRRVQVVADADDGPRNQVRTFLLFLLFARLLVLAGRLVRIDRVDKEVDGCLRISKSVRYSVCLE